ncbi:hypothetical protein [Terriglobus sp. TAA 43]|uniref:hypothetical protein n=1 Tax=Terriglobus sp. TAA 43 TaxID=278961 RepID=UPI0006456843|nr:hypothetical protein [Terriglobus sp. TAA 43]
MQTKFKIAAVVSAKLLLVSCLLAQSTPQTVQQPAASNITDQQPDFASNDGPSSTAPVLWVSSVEVMRSAHGPQLDVIRVRGLASTEGWESAQLVPLTRGIPADGMLDLALVADAPQDVFAPTAYPAIEAIFTIEPGHPFKGVRVHGAANRVTLNTLPGYAVSATAPKDCVDCQGKIFVAKGQAVPANAKAGFVREEDLPRNLRVIREGDGLGSFESNPNRMTILLNEQGQIITALWN